MRACIVQGHRAGLFSLINKVIVCLDRWDAVQVDFSMGDGCDYGPPGHNVWNDLFEPMPYVPFPDDADRITAYPDMAYTSMGAGFLYQTSPPWWRTRFHALWSQLRVRAGVAEDADNLCFGGDTVSAIIRCHGHAGEQVTQRSQPLEEYAAAFERVRLPNSRLHVMCGDEETLGWFADRFPITYAKSPRVRRVPTRSNDHFVPGGQSISDARTCLAEVIAVSRARALIHPVSNMATAALYMNPQLESVYLK